MSAAVAGAAVAAAAWAVATDRPSCQLPATTTAWTPIPPVAPGPGPQPLATPAVPGSPAIAPIPVVVAPPPSIDLHEWDDCPACGMG